MCIYCTSNFYVWCIAGSVHRLGRSLLMKLRFSGTWQQSSWSYTQHPLAALPIVYFHSAYSDVGSLWTPYRETDVANWLSVALAPLGWAWTLCWSDALAAPADVAVDCQFWLALAPSPAPGRPDETTQLSSCSAGVCFIDSVRMCVNAREEGGMHARVIKAAGVSRSEWKWFHQRWGLLQLLSVQTRGGGKVSSLCLRPACLP